MRIAFLSAVLALMALWGCGGCGGDARPGPPKVFEAPQALDRAQGEGPVPLVWLSVGSSVEVELGPGWPWVIEGMLQHPAALGDSWTGDFLVTSDDGTAEGALALVLTDAVGDPVEVRFERLGDALSEPLTLGPDTEAWPGWRLPPAESAKLGIGDYRLMLRITTPTFQASSPAVEIRISEEGDDPYAAALAAADDALARGALVDAKQALDGILATAPKEDRALTRMGLLHERAGDLPAALDAYQAALAAAVEREPDAPEGGPRHLFHAIQRVELATEGGAP